LSRYGNGTTVGVSIVTINDIEFPMSKVYFNNRYLDKIKDNTSVYRCIRASILSRFSFDGLPTKGDAFQFILIYKIFLKDQ